MNSALWPGVLFCGAVATISFATSLAYKPISSLMWAFIYSIIVTNGARMPDIFSTGINFCAREFLRAVIAAVGIVTSALIWFQVGVGIINSLAITFSAFFLALWFGKKFGLNDGLTTLIGVGTAICGASAIAATAPAIKAREEEVGLAVACITLFGLIAMFLYPFLYTNTVVGEWLNHNLNLYAIWCGSGIHEVAQVAAAGGALGVEGSAVLVKSVRVFMIGPMILLATYMFRKKEEKTSVFADKKGRARAILPVYGVVFILLSICCAFLDAYSLQIKSLGLDWPLVKTALSNVILKFLLALCFAAVGLKVEFRKIVKLGVKPLAVGAIVALLAGVLALILAIAVAPFVTQVPLI